MEFGSISSLLGITDPTFDLTVAQYGEPSKNMSDMTKFPEFSPMQQWEMWLNKPEPSIVHDPQLLEGFSRLEALLQSILAKLVPSTSLSKLIGVVTDNG